MPALNLSLSSFSALTRTYNTQPSHSTWSISLLLALMFCFPSPLPWSQTSQSPLRFHLPHPCRPCPACHTQSQYYPSPSVQFLSSQATQCCWRAPRNLQSGAITNSSLRIDVPSLYSSIFIFISVNMQISPPQQPPHTSPRRIPISAWSHSLSANDLI